jgi:plastocyanin
LARRRERFNLTPLADGAVPMRRALPAFLLPFLLAGCSGGDAAFDGEVEVDDDYFEPKEATIKAGDRIHFEVEASAKNKHTVSIHKAGDAPAQFVNFNVSAGDDVSYNFDLPGTYHVWCQLHGTMTDGMAMLVTVE